MPADDQPLDLIADLEGLSQALVFHLNPGKGSGAESGKESDAEPGQAPDLDLEALLTLLDQRESLLAKLPALLPVIQSDPSCMARIEALSAHDTELISRAQAALHKIQQELQGLGRNFNATTSYLEQGNFEETSYYFENQG